MNNHVENAIAVFIIRFDKHVKLITSQILSLRAQINVIRHLCALHEPTNCKQTRKKPMQVHPVELAAKDTHHSSKASHELIAVQEAVAISVEAAEHLRDRARHLRPASAAKNLKGALHRHQALKWLTPRGGQRD